MQTASKKAGRLQFVTETGPARESCGIPLPLLLIQEKGDGGLRSIRVFYASPACDDIGDALPVDASA